MVELTKPLPYVGITPLRLLTAVAVLVGGYIVIKVIVILFRKSLKRTKLPTLASEFLCRFLSALLYVFLILLTAGILGFSVGSVVIGLSAVLGLILGFGLQDTITNLAAGIWIAAFRPIDIGEVVTISGQTGKVESVGVMSTVLVKPDNTMVTMPNKLVWGNVIVNHTRLPIKRVSVDVGVAYGTNLDRAIKLAVELMRGHPKVLKDPEPSVVVTELADSSINLQLRAWVKTEDYWGVKGDLTKGIYELYSREGIEIPFPQLDVHLTTEGENKA